MTDRELLELAAKAVGKDSRLLPFDLNDWTWNPLKNDGDALRLAVSLGLLDGSGDYLIYRSQGILKGLDPFAATRWAIVRAAAQIGK